MRGAGRLRLGFYPLPLSEAQRIRRWISFPDVVSAVVDPCVGDGMAFAVIADGAKVLRYGIELDAFARALLRQIHLVQIQIRPGIRDPGAWKRLWIELGSE